MAREADRERLRRARAALKQARALKASSKLRAKETCRSAREQVRAWAVNERLRVRDDVKRMREETRATIAGKRQHVRATCSTGKLEAVTTGDSQIQTARATLDQEREQARRERIWRGSGKPKAQTTAREARQESDDEVTGSLTGDELFVWEAVKSKIRSTDRMSRLEAFQHWIHEHSGEVARILDAQYAGDVARLEREEHEAREAMKPRNYARATEAELGARVSSIASLPPPPRLPSFVPMAPIAPPSLPPPSKAPKAPKASKASKASKATPEVEKPRKNRFYKDELERCAGLDEYELVNRLDELGNALSRSSEARAQEWHERMFAVQDALKVLPAPKAPRMPSVKPPTVAAADWKEMRLGLKLSKLKKVLEYERDDYRLRWAFGSQTGTFITPDERWYTLEVEGKWETPQGSVYMFTKKDKAWSAKLGPYASMTAGGLFEAALQASQEQQQGTRRDSVAPF